MEVYIPCPYVTKSKYILDDVRDIISSGCFICQETTVAGFVSNVGGLMGLCMGLSLVSLVEVVIAIAQFIRGKVGIF